MSGDSINQISGVRVQMPTVNPVGAPGKPSPQPQRQALPQDGESLPVATQPGPERSVESAVGELSDYVQSVNRQLEFSIDDASGRTIIKVIDSRTRETIRQIPAEELLVIAEHLREALDDTRGFFLRAEA